MAKAILTIVRNEINQQEINKYYVFVIQGSYKLDINKVGELLGKSKRQWRFATQKEVIQLFGLEIGGVPPFGYGKDVAVFFDTRLRQLETVFCGIGNPNKSIEIKVEDLIKISNTKIADIANTNIF